LIDSLPSRQAGGATKKYLLYAIGEILLVMIGILLALQVNNWNEERKKNDVEIKLLKELISGTEADIESNQYTLMRNKESMTSLNILIPHIEKKLPYHDSLPYHFQMAHNRWVGLFSNHAYQNAKEFGLDFLPDSTRFLLVYQNEKAIEYLQMLEERNTQYYYNVIAPKLTSLFQITYPQGRRFKDMTPLNYETLLTDREYLVILKSIHAYKEQYLEWQEYVMIGNRKKLILQLNLELEGI